jgi:hypothetical protein
MMAPAKTALTAANLESDYSLFEGNGAVKNRENAANT